MSLPSEEDAAPAGTEFAKGHFSVAKLPASWLVACMSSELGEKPVARVLQDIPIVLFRDGDGRAHALLDRCPHRNVPLSLGRVVGGNLQCAYHGWEFSGAGECMRVPSLVGPAANKSRRAPTFHTREQDGLVWVYSTAEAGPTNEPFAIELARDSRYTVVHQVVEANGTLFSTLENALDVPHTAFLHKGLFRTKSREITITARVKRTKERVEVEYIGEPRPPGIVGKVLSPSGGVVQHTDRFILPCIAQVEYAIGEENHIVVTAAMTPVSDFVTRIHSVTCVRTRLPTKALAKLIKPLALKIFRQDAVVLAQQTALIKRFGGERFVHTEIDVIGKHIWRLLKERERGEPMSDAVAFEGEAKLVV